MNGSTPNEGRLELRRDGGVWGTVKGCLWTGREAQIACLALGFRGHLSPHRCSEKFGSGSGPIHIDLYQCYESTLAECLDTHASEWDKETTRNDHGCDIGIICLPGKLRSSISLKHQNYFIAVFGIPIEKCINKYKHACCRFLVFHMNLTMEFSKHIMGKDPT